MEIQRVVAGNAETWEFIDISKADILLEMLGQVDGRLYEELMPRTLAIGIIPCRVLAILVFANIHLEVAVRTHQLPPGKYFPLCEGLNAVCSTAHFVAGDKGLDDICWNRAAFNKRLTRFRGTKIRVVVVKTSNVKR